LDVGRFDCVAGYCVQIIRCAEFNDVAQAIFAKQFKGCEKQKILCLGQNESILFPGSAAASGCSSACLRAEHRGDIQCQTVRRFHTTILSREGAADCARGGRAPVQLNRSG
jgi:hypothetical protein